MSLAINLCCYVIVFHVMFSQIHCQIQIPIGILLDASSEPESKTAIMFALSLHNKRRMNEPKIHMVYDDYSGENNFDFIKKVCIQMSTGIFLMYGSMSSTTFQTCQSYSNQFHMPFVSNYFPGSEFTEHKGQLLFMKPNYVKAISEIILMMGWKNFTYMFDHLDGVHRLETIKTHLGHHQVHVNLVQLYQVSSVHEDLRSVDVSSPDEEKFIVVDVANRTALSSLIKQIAEVGMNREGYNYILASLDALTLDLSQLRYGGATVYSFQAVDFDTSQTKSLQLIWKSLEPRVWPGAGTDTITFEVASSMDAIELIKRSIIALIVSKKDIFQFTFRRGNVYNINSTIGLKCGGQPIQPWMHGTDLYTAFMKVNFEGFTGNIQFDGNGKRDNFSINIIAVTAGSKPRKIGEWHSVSGIRLENGYNVQSHLKTDQSHNRTQHPFLMLQNQLEADGIPPLDNNRYEGYTKDLADEISSHLNFQYTLKVAEDGECGRNLGNGSWTGMIGGLIDKTADMAIGPLTISLDREKVVDFSMSFMKSGISALLHQPAKVKPNMFSFMEPFSLSLWLSILLACIGVSLVLFIVHCFQIDPFEATETEKYDLTLKNSIWFIISSLLSQGSDIFLSSPASRILGGTWWFFVLIMLSSYTANLAAFLTIDRIQRPIKSLNDLLAQKEISYGTIENGFPREFFESTNILSYKQLWETMSESYHKVIVKSVEEGMQRVQTSRGKYAILLESSIAENYKNRKPCNTIEIMSSFNHKGFGIATQSRSVLMKEINYAILHLKEDGTLRKLKQKWWDDKNECLKKKSSKDSKTRSLELTSVLGIFLILILGLFLAVCVLTVQTVIERQRKEHELQIIEKN